MTSLAALFDWLAAGKALGNTAARSGDAENFRLRSLPKEDIHLYVKAIDNTTVIRVVDKKDFAASLGMAGGVVMASLLLIAMLLPGGYSLLASRRVEQLRSERSQLVNEMRMLRVKEAAVLNPHTIEQWAGDKFVNPAAAAVVYAPPTKGTVASLGKR